MATDIDDVETSAHGLADLLDLLLDHISGMPFEREGMRDRRMDQLFSLARLSRDEMRRTADDITALCVQSRQAGGRR